MPSRIEIATDHGVLDRKPEAAVRGDDISHLPKQSQSVVVLHSAVAVRIVQDVDQFFRGMPGAPADAGSIATRAKVFCACVSCAGAIACNS